eukprot:scaffold1849_cov107-Isochrysis_galbana.AAC.5
MVPQCTHIEGIATSVRASLGADSPPAPFKMCNECGEGGWFAGGEKVWEERWGNGAIIHSLKVGRRPAPFRAARRPRAHPSTSHP